MTFSEDRAQPDASTAQSSSISPVPSPSGSHESAWSGYGYLKPGAPTSTESYETDDQESYQHIAPRRLQFSQSSTGRDDVSLNSEDFKSWIIEYGEKALAQARSLFERNEKASAYLTACTALNAVVQTRSNFEETYHDLLGKFVSLEGGVKSPKAIVQRLKDYIDSLEKQISSLTDQNDSLTLQGQVSKQTAQEAMYTITSRDEEIQQLHADKQNAIMVLKETIQRLKSELESRQMLEERLLEAEKTMISATRFQVGSYEEMNRLQCNLIDFNNGRTVQHRHSARHLRRPSSKTQSPKLDRKILTTPSGSLHNQGKSLYDELGGQWPQSTALPNMFENPRPAPKPAQDSRTLHELPRIVSHITLVKSPASFEDAESAVVNQEPVHSEHGSGEAIKTNSLTFDFVRGHGHDDADSKPSVVVWDNVDTGRPVANASSQHSSDVIHKSLSSQRASGSDDLPQLSSLPTGGSINTSHDGAQSSLSSSSMSTTCNKLKTAFDEKKATPSSIIEQFDEEPYMSSDHLPVQRLDNRMNPASAQAQPLSSQVTNDARAKSSSTQLSCVLRESISNRKDGFNELSLMSAEDNRESTFIVDHFSNTPIPLRNRSSRMINDFSDSDSSGDLSGTQVSNQTSKPASISSHTSLSSPSVDIAQEDSTNALTTSTPVIASGAVRDPNDIGIQKDAERQEGNTNTPSRSIDHGLPTPPSSKQRIRKSSISEWSVEYGSMTPSSLSRRGYRATTSMTSLESDSDAYSKGLVTSKPFSPSIGSLKSRRVSLRLPSDPLESDSAAVTNLTPATSDHYLHNNSLQAARGSLPENRQSVNRKPKRLLPKTENADQVPEGLLIDRHHDVFADMAFENTPSATREDHPGRSLSGSTDVSFGSTRMSKEFEKAINAWFDNDSIRCAITSQPSRVKRERISLQRAEGTQIDKPGFSTFNHVSLTEGNGSAGATSSEREVRVIGTPDCVDEVVSTRSSYCHGGESHDNTTEQQPRVSRGSEGHSSSVEVSPHEILRRRSLGVTGPVKAAERFKLENLNVVKAAPKAARSTFRQTPRSFDFPKNDRTTHGCTASCHDLLNLCVKWMQQNAVFLYINVVTALSAVPIWIERLCEMVMIFSIIVTWPSMQLMGYASNLTIWHCIHFTIALIFLSLTYQVYLIRQHWYNANTSQVREIVIGWKETQWESNILKFLRWQLESAIERHLPGGQPMHST